MERVTSSAAFAGDNFPRAHFPCMVGRPLLRFEEAFNDEEIGDIVVGDECARLRHNLEVTYPISNGMIQSWDDMHHIWDHTFKDALKVDPRECKILLTDPPLNPVKNREDGGDYVRDLRLPPRVHPGSGRAHPVRPGAPYWPPCGLWGRRDTPSRSRMGSLPQHQAAERGGKALHDVPVRPPQAPGVQFQQNR